MTNPVILCRGSFPSKVLADRCGQFEVVASKDSILVASGFVATMNAVLAVSKFPSAAIAIEDIFQQVRVRGAVPGL